MDFFENISKEKKINFNMQQQKAVIHNEGPCLVLAVPGSGKTTALIARTAYLNQVHQIPLENILSLTFSKAAASDMKQRYISNYSEGKNRKVHFMTIHSFSYRVVTAYYKKKGIEFTLIEGTSSSTLNKGQILKSLFNKIVKRRITENEYDVLTNAISFNINNMSTYEEIQAYEFGGPGFHEIYDSYIEIKMQNKYIDFDDMLLYCYKIFSAETELLAAYQKRFQYIQVDEAQDTSKLQHSIINLLAAGHKNIFYVADDDQSIYGFRAANPKFLLEIEKEYEETKILRMEQNYRSTKRIVNLGNKVIENNKARYPKSMVTDNELGNKIMLKRLNETEEQYLYISHKIVEKKSDLKNFAVLYRLNASALMIAKELESNKIPYKIKGYKDDFFSHWVTRVMVQILDFVEDQTDAILFEKIFGCFRGYYISRVMVENIIKQGLGENVFERILSFNRLEDYKQDNVYRMKRAFRSMSGYGLVQKIDYILEEMGVLEYLTDRSEDDETTLENYLIKIDILKDLAKDCGNVDELHAELELYRASLEKASKNNSEEVVTLSTLHSSKGLEWNDVFLVNVFDGVFPHKYAIENDDETAMEEERRLFYVGITRAKKNLTCFSVYDKPSSFVNSVVDVLRKSNIVE